MSSIDAETTILVIDDDPFLIETISSSLSLLGHYQVLSASDGQMGLELLNKYCPDAVVVDVGMPALDGYQVVRAIRGDPKTENIPIIILSARVLDIDHERGLLSGADYYLNKPIDPNQLVRSVENALAISQRERELRIMQQARAQEEDL
jgi:CheY-like chemotaxis protein